MLRVEGLQVSFGPVVALRGISLTVGDSEFVSVIGPNGAGKTTLLRSISRTAAWDAGEIEFDGRPLAGMPADRVARLGIAHVPEGRRIFGQMTVEENLEIGAMKRVIDREALETIYGVFPQLAGLRRRRAVTLSGGEQQMLAIGRGLMSRPRLLMLDEPSMGLAPVIVEQIFDYIAQLGSSAALSVLLVEQRATEALEVSERTYVLEQGMVALAGRSAELLQSTEVQKAYLGVA